MQIAKLHMNMAKDHPAGYALLPNSIDLAHGYWGLIRQFGESYGSSSPVSTSAAQMNGTDREERFDLQEKLCRSTPDVQVVALLRLSHFKEESD